MLLPKIRWLIRLLAATVIWSHALMILPIYQPPIGRWAAAINLTESEAVLILILAFLSVLWSYGLSKFALDLGYIYVFPFVLLFYFIRLLLGAIRLFYKMFFPEESAALVAPAQEPTETVPVLPSQSVTKTSGKRTRRAFGKRLALDVSRPIRQFTLLWGLLLLLSSRPWLVWVALAIIMAHLFRTLLKILVLTVFSMKWLSGLEGKLEAYAEGLITKVLEASQKAEGTKQTEVRKWLGILIGLKTAAAILASKRFVAQAVLALGFVAFAVVYVYISLLFSFAYYGVAHVLSIGLSWGQALVISIFIPVMVTALPHNAWLLLLGGLHAFFVLSLGVGTVLGYLGKKLDTFRNAAETLNSRLEKEEVKKAMTQLAKELNMPYPGAESAPSA